LNIMAATSLQDAATKVVQSLKWHPKVILQVECVL
jgi:hypothetical protein